MFSVGRKTNFVSAFLALIVLAGSAVSQQRSVDRGAQSLVARQWTSGPAMLAARAGSASARLADGRTLITGGAGVNGAMASAEVLGLDGNFSAVSPMRNARQDHFSVALANGKVLVAGGTGTTGGASNAAELYDPDTDEWAAVGAMASPRAHATATLLRDGRVLIAGGTVGSSPSNTLELFDPATGTFTSVPALLSSPRQGHAAAALWDGRVLIAGGTDGHAALRSVDVFDPGVPPGPGRVSPAFQLSTPRAGLSATALLTGDVLFAGGNDGANDLDTAEVYHAAAGKLGAPVQMAAARRDHIAISLPDNNTVLFVGGTSAGAALNTAELYVPWRNEFQPAGVLARTRVASTASPHTLGELLVAGGRDAAGATALTEKVTYATLTSDKKDYSPGQTVVLTGTGWHPRELVTIVMSVSPRTHPNVTLTSQADSKGNFINSNYVVQQSDLGVTFYVTATGAAGDTAALLVFTDSPSMYVTVALNPTTVFVTNPTTAQATLSTHGSCVPASGETVNWTHTGSGSFSSTSCIVNSSLRCSVTFTPSSATGSPLTITAAESSPPSGCAAGSGNASLTVSAQTSQTITVDTHAPASAAYNSSFNVAAHASSGLAVTVAGSGGCSGGGASSGNPGSNVTITMTSGTTACTVTFSQAGNGQYSAASNVTSNTTATPATQTINVTTAALASAAYNATFPVAANATSGLGVAITTTGACSGSGTASATITMSSGTGTCTVHYNQSGNANYSAASEVTSNTTATPATQTINVTTAALASAAYNATFPVAATATSGLGVAITTSGACSGSGTASATITMTSGTGTCTVHYNQSGNANYSAASEVTSNTTATPATQTINVTTAALASAAYNATFPVAANATSGLGVAITTSGACSGSGTASATITMTSSTGTCTVHYNQSGNANYSAASEVTSNTTATPSGQTIAFSLAGLPHQYYGNPAIDISSYASATSGLPVTFTWASGPCSVAGTVVALTGAGFCQITANQAGNGNENAATPVSQTFLIDSRLQAAPSSNKVGLTWNYYTGGTSYSVFKSGDQGTVAANVNCAAPTGGYSLAATVSANTYLVTGLTNSHYYCFYVTATGVANSQTMVVAAAPKGFGL